MLQIGGCGDGEASERSVKKTDERVAQTVFEGKLVEVRPAKGAFARSAQRYCKHVVALLSVQPGADMALLAPLRCTVHLFKCGRLQQQFLIQKSHISPSKSTH